MNIVLVVLVLVLVLAVGIAAGMAGRIRKQEAAQTAAENETTPDRSGAAAEAAEESGAGPEESAGAEETAEAGMPAEAEKTAEAGMPAEAEKIAEAGMSAEAETFAGPEETAGAEASAGGGESNAAAPAAKTVHVEVDGRTVLECPLAGEAKYAIVDGTAVELDVDTTLEDMQGIADPENHDVNLIYIHDGKVACTESNCDNQVCVHTGELTGSAFDLPIICLPHGLVVQVIE